MAIQKKHGKGRLDKWYKLAKEKGYRARAAFKLIQLNKKYGFLEKSKVLLDLCAAPGSWSQVAAEVMPVNSLIVGVDLAPIKPIPRVITFQSDITTDKCRATIRQHFKTWKADTVLHDGAPNVGTAWTQDSFNQAELALQAMKLATEFLVEGGTFVTKVFRSKDYNPLLWVLNQLFTKVDATKPPSSRNVSAEIFVVCRGYKAPKRIDPRFLDPRSVFAELAGATPNNEAKVYNPETKKRKRDGYDEADYTQHKEISASEFIHTTDPIAILGTYNKLTFHQSPNGDIALAALDRLPETTPEIRQCCADLKVLGRKDFKLLLRWRLKVRAIFNLAAKETEGPSIVEETAEVTPMDAELEIEQELQRLRERESSQRKRERRKENERKQREILRMQLNMVAPMDIGMEESQPGGEGSMFSVKTVDKGDALRNLSKGRMILPSNTDENMQRNSGSGLDAGSDGESDEEEDGLERRLDSMYEQYRDRRLEADAKYRAKKAREEHNDEWEGLSADEEALDSDSLELESYSSDDDEPEKFPRNLVTDLSLDEERRGGLSKKAASFFDQEIFRSIAPLEAMTPAPLDSSWPRNDVAHEAGKKVAKHNASAEDLANGGEGGTGSEYDDDDMANGIEEAGMNNDNEWEEDHHQANGQPNIDIITAEAMTLAHQLATGKRSTQDAIDDGFNKRALRDRDGLPEWFLDDESKHDKVLKPITKAAASAIQEKMRALNARPIKKVREARARKKFKAAQRLEKLKKKSDMLANDEGMTEREKADSITRLLNKASRSKPRQTAKLVVAKGLNRGIKGRPKGVKGRYRIVDPRMKKELRAQKRVSQRKR